MIPTLFLCPKGCFGLETENPRVAQPSFSEIPERTGLNHW